MKDHDYQNPNQRGECCTVHDPIIIGKCIMGELLGKAVISKRLRLQVMV